MPIINTNKPVPVAKVKSTPEAISPVYHSATVDSRYDPSVSLLTHIEGATWTVTYYEQVVDVDNELQPQQLTLDAAYQQYIKINGLELKVSSDLATTQNSVTKEMELTGSSLLYPYIIPNKGNMFVADVGDGRQGVFTITSTERKTILKETCHVIEYVLVDYLTDERAKDLEDKTIKTTYFVKEFLQHGQNPVIVDSEYDAVVNLKRGYRKLLSHYFADFFSLEFSTFLVPDQEYSTYDPFITKAIINTLDTSEFPLIKSVRPLNVSEDQAMKMINLWDCLLAMSSDLLVMAGQRYGLVRSTYFDVDARYDGIRYSGIKYVVYPVDERTDVDADYCPPHDLITGLIVQGKTRTSDVRRMVHDTTLNGFYEGDVNGEGIDVLPDIHSVVKDEFYIFSEAFYYDEPTAQSKLEKLALQGLENQAIDLMVLNDLVSNAKRWGNLERFYYIPILLMLIKQSLRGF